MATNTNKTNARKTTTRKVASPAVEKVEAKEVKAVEKPVVTKKTFSPEDGIPCRSITIGGLYLDGVKSGNFYNWVDYGDVMDVEYRDLAAMVRGKSNYVFAPLMVIDDDDFIAEFPQLQKFYDDQYSIQDLEGVLKLSVNDMIATMKTLPSGALNSLKSIASTAITNGQLDSMSKIKALDEFFDTNLALIAEFANN